MHSVSRLFAAATLAVSAAVLASCSDSPLGVRTPETAPVRRTISDGASTGSKEFFWLPPAVASTPAFDGVFDANALADLSAEVCRLDQAGDCTGEVIERISATSQPASQRLSLNALEESYDGAWQSGPSRADAGESYRLSILRGTTVLGFVDIAMVKNTPAIALVDASRYTAIVKGQQFRFRFRLEQPRARNYVRFNEVESNGGTPGDWVELYNTNSQALDLSGYLFKDNDDTHVYVIPAGTTIPGHGYLVLDELMAGVGNFDFGLGGNETARLFAPDGATLVDSYAWTAHATPTTYGRCGEPGTSPFATTSIVTKGTANDCDVLIRINEIESEGGTPGDWVELHNPANTSVSLAGYQLRGGVDAKSYTLPAGTTIPANGLLVVEQASLGFALDAADAVRLFRPNGVNLVDTYSWTGHAATSYGRCPNGTGGFVVTGATTKGTTNNCAVPTTAVKINEVESNGGTPGDWVELYNTSGVAVDLSGYVLRDNDDTHNYVLPAGTVIAANGFLVLNEIVGGVGNFDFGLGAADNARLFSPGAGTLVDSYGWTAHATTTYGRCPNGTGAFIATTASTKGTANNCGPSGEILFSAWPGAATVTTVDAGNVFPSNLSGLYQVPSGTGAAGTLFAVRNGPGALFKLLWNGSIWTPDAADNWGGGKLLRYPDGLGDVDAEGVTLVGNSVYVSSERNNSASSVSRLAILLYDATAAGATLTAVREWNLTGDLPVVGANLGLEGITYVPDAYLTSRGFRDESTGQLYNPANYADHNGGLFLVGVEGTGNIYAYALNHTSGAFTKVATFASGFSGVMDLSFDRELNQLWVICDDTCNGRSAVFKIDQQAGSATLGKFVFAAKFERPTGMPNTNNEGFALGAQAECVSNQKPAYWSDDAAVGGFAIRKGMVSCTTF